jgi:XTP/dITP diphosphohydrolase
MTLYCATTNPGKLREFRLAAKRLGVSVEPVPGFESIEPAEETGATFEENAIQKAVYYSRYAPGPLFADDSGLEIDALGGEPGVRSARFAGPEATDEANNRKALERLAGVAQRSARFVCTIAVAERGAVLATFRGVVEGEMLDAPRGTNGFGYDPLFYYPPFGCTLAQVSAGRKLDVSHRGQALRQLLEWASSRG